MRHFKWFILGLLLASPAAYPLAGTAVQTDHVKARLIGELTAIEPGQSMWVALELDIRAGWHTYWRNPGDSGQATQLVWTLPAGFTAGQILWAAPQRFELPPLVNYGYAKHVMHLVLVTAPKTFETGAPVTLAAKASWLVCSDICIPESAVLELPMPVNPMPVGSPQRGIDTATAMLFTAARALLPAPAPAATHAVIRNGQLVLVLGKEWGATRSQIESLAFFPYDEGSIEYGAVQTLTRTADSIELAVKVGYKPPQSGTLRGVLLATEQNGGAVLTVPLEIGAQLTAAASQTLPMLLLLAMLGGLILNLMPCVFPVLSIKAMALVEQAKKQPAAVRAKGLLFAAGVIGSMLCLAAVLLVLRAGGEQIGWGFQLQSPLFVTLMMYLLLAVALNLSGVFEIGGGLAGVGDGLTRGEGYRAALFTGVLTTLVATPCTAPFMAAAVGAALTQSPAVALSIFAALGMGLALPYMLLSFAPWMRRALPKPGAWMDTLKQVFAFPIYASAAWLLWVLAQQTSSIGLGAALAGAILIAWAAWSYQKSKQASAGGRVSARICAAVAVLLAIALPVRFADLAGAAPKADAWQPYDAARVAELSAAGRPLLVNFTASWCLTCLVNERNAFADTAVQELFQRKGVILMKGDWTRRDPSITTALAAFGRAGVPLYVVYNSKPGTAPPLVLPQLLTASIVQGVFAALPDRGRF